MQTFTPARATPLATQSDASAALKRLARSATTTSTELLQLPDAHPALLDALNTGNTVQGAQEIASLLQRIDDFWRAPGVEGTSRRTLFTDCLKTALQDEAVLKSHENDLRPNALACIALPADVTGMDRQRHVSVCSLHVRLNDLAPVEINGALVMSVETGRTLLALPGSGLAEFATQQAMLETVADWLNDPERRWALLLNASQRHQDAVSAVADDPDLFIEAFDTADVQLYAVSGNPYRHALQRQIEKQREDVLYACGDGLASDAQLHASRIQGAIHMLGLLGPSAMLERREQALAERKLRTGLPDWIKIAAPEDLKEYAGRLTRYDQAREALSSVLNGAESAEQYAQVRLRASLANDLGYDLEPGKITVSTQRSLPGTDEPYVTHRTLPELALYGLHPGDHQAGSEFLTATTISIDGTPAGTGRVLLTPAYIARQITELKLRLSFGDYQRAAYTNAANKELMCGLLRLQVAEASYAAKMQGAISVEDFELIEAITRSTPAQTAAMLRVQHLKINDSGVLGRVLVLRKENAQGDLERLIMFTSDAPSARLFHSFHSENQLLEELVGWTASPEMSDYLLQQLPAALHPMLNATLEALRQKPHPEPDFVQLVSLDSYDEGLRTLVEGVIQLTLSSHQAHTPSWYVQASETERQKLVALEDAVAGARKNHEAQTHTKVQDFEDYVHQRASEKICQLLGVPAGTVDPDQIVITSERETLTYTQMIRNGYDDSIGFLNPAADTVATFRGPEGLDLGALTPASVAGSVRGKWLGDAYTALVRRTLLDAESIGYDYRRQASALITRLQMQAAALRSLLKGQIDAGQYQWLEEATSNVHRTDPELRRRYPVYPLQIHVDKPFIASHLALFDQLVISDTNLTHVETVQGCFALMSADTRYAALLYTPKAPDGLEFRVFSSFVESLSSPGMIDYYKDRCRIKARRILSFFLNDMKQGNGNKAPALPKASIADFAQICFNRVIERKLRDVEETTTGRNDMLSSVIWTSVDLIITVLTLPFPPASFVVGVALAVRDQYQALQALTGESPEDASALIFASILNMAGAAGDLNQGLKGFGGVWRKLSRHTKEGAPPTAFKNASPPRSLEGLSPVQLQNEPFFIGKPNANGHAPVYRNAGFDADEAYVTRHYAVRDSAGVWQPLQQPSAAVGQASDNGVSANRVVNVSLQDLPRLAEGHAKGIHLGKGQYYIELNGSVYQVHYDASIRCWHIVNPENPFAFFGRQPVTLDDQGQWQLIERSRLRGGGNDGPAGYRPVPAAASASSTSPAGLQHYELPKHLQPHLYQILNGSSFDPAGYGLGDYYELYYVQMRQIYATLRDNLYREARAFFAEAVPLPPRPVLPVIDTSTTVGSFLDNVFTQSNGLVLSEAPKSIASKRFLITHMQDLADQRVEVLYIPHLFTDKHLGKLAKYRGKGPKIRAGSRELKSHLEYLNNKALDNLSSEYDYYHVIKAAHRHNIEVRPLSSSLSYPVVDYPVATVTTDSTAAQKMSNFFGHKVISGDMAPDPSKRWVALLDQKLATNHNQIPGIAEMEGAISAHIEDVPAGRTTLISQDTPLVALDAQPTPCDFTIEFASPSITEPAAAPAIPGAADNLVPGTSTASALADDASAETVGLRWNDASGWQRVESQQWVAQSPPTALQQSLADAAYEMPLPTRGTLHDLAYLKRRGLDREYFFSDPDMTTVREQFFALRATLQNDARRILTTDLAPRPRLPVIDPQPSAAEFIQRLYQQTDGVVVGEFHASIGSKKFIIDNLPLLVQQNVKTLYMEHLLTDLHQLDLDRFFETGVMSDNLLSSLRSLDNGHMTDPAKVYNFEKLVIKAQQHGLEIRAIDCAASYHLKGLSHETATSRQQMMNYFASRTIRRHQAIMGKHKWVALVGNSHANTYAQSVPGLAELEAAIGLRMDDVPRGTSRGITLDPGENLLQPMSRQKAFVKSDFRVEVEVLASPATIRPPQPLSLEQRLSRPGMFVTEQEHDGLQMIIHRSRDREIHRTSVQINTEGKVFVDRPGWPAVHLQPYDDIDALVLALEEINLTRVG